MKYIATQAVPINCALVWTVWHLECWFQEMIFDCLYLIAMKFSNLPNVFYESHWRIFRSRNIHWHSDCSVVIEFVFHLKLISFISIGKEGKWSSLAHNIGIAWACICTVHVFQCDTFCEYRCVSLHLSKFGTVSIVSSHLRIERGTERK